MKDFIPILATLCKRKNGDIIARRHVKMVKSLLDGDVNSGDDKLIFKYDVLNYMEARGSTSLRESMCELKHYDNAVTAERSPTATELSKEHSDHANKSNEEWWGTPYASHKYTCACHVCRYLNALDNKLTDRKRYYQQEMKHETTTTSKESHKEAVEKTLKIFFGDTIRRAKVRKDGELPERSKQHVPHAGGYPKIRIIRYIKGSLLDELIRESNSDKLPSSKEAFKVTEVQSNSDRRSSPMDRRVSEDVAVMERFETAYAELSRDLQLGNIDARDFREFISHAFAEFTESLGEVSDGQTGLAIQ